MNRFNVDEKVSVTANCMWRFGGWGAYQNCGFGWVSFKNQDHTSLTYEAQVLEKFQIMQGYCGSGDRYDCYNAYDGGYYSHGIFQHMDGLVIFIHH